MWIAAQLSQSSAMKPIRIQAVHDTGLLMSWCVPTKKKRLMIQALHVNGKRPNHISLRFLEIDPHISLIELTR